MSPLVVALVTVALIALSAFFVAAEFAVLAVRRHRLEERAGTSRAVRAALRSHDELTVLLAGCQLGITACALGLGAITKPAVQYSLTPLIDGWGAPGWVAGVVGFAVALLVVTFLHLVIGEMAPKSWAIAHPETSAIALALPMRAFMFVFRPILTLLNNTANWCLRRVGVTPQDSVASGQDADDLRQLVAHSAEIGALDPAFSAHLIDTLDLQTTTLADLVDVEGRVTAVGVDVDAAAVRDAARASGHLRVLVRDAAGYRGFVHVRDTMTHPDHHPVGDLVRPVPVLDGATAVHDAVRQMREQRAHVVLVDVGGRLGVLTLHDVLVRLFPSPAAS